MSISPELKPKQSQMEEEEEKEIIMD